MFNQMIFGEKLKGQRKQKNLTQEELAERIGVSGQAVSKWEKSECLPDVYNIKLLSRVFRISVDSMLETEKDEKIIDVINVNGAIFEIIEKPETIYAGKIAYTKDGDYVSIISDEIKNRTVIDKVVNFVLPEQDITMSINFWLEPKSRGMGIIKEVYTAEQPEGVDIFKMSASLFIKAYTDKEMAKHLSAGKNEKCEPWEAFAYIRGHIMPAYGYKMAENGAQELEIYDTRERKSGYAYMPVIKI